MSVDYGRCAPNMRKMIEMKVKYDVFSEVVYPTFVRWKIRHRSPRHHQSGSLIQWEN
jgi:hypothetical protein